MSVSSRVKEGKPRLCRAHLNAAFQLAWQLKRRLASGRVAAPRSLEEEPDALLGLVDPHLEQARGCDIAVLVAHAVRGTQLGCEAHVVVAQLGQHVERR